VRLAPGSHELEARGSMPASDTLTLAFGDVPQRTRVRASGFKVDGVRDDGRVEQAVQLSRVVTAPGSDVLLQSGAGSAGVELPAAADQVSVTIRGAAGEIIKTINMGAQDAGIRTFRWDGSTDTGGRAKDGIYTFEVTATQAGKKVDAVKLGAGVVQSVSLGNGDLQLNTIGLGAVSIGQVKQIL